MIEILIIIAAACIVILGVILGIGLKASRDWDNRMDDISNGKFRYKYPKK